MAYVGNQLSLIAASIENSGGNSAVLVGSDSIGTVTGANYISDGQKRGLVLGSNVWYFNGTTAYQCYVSAVQAFPLAGVTLTQVSGGGGGVAIQPESGPAIKISAITAAPLNMGADDVVTGLQGGANVNFSQSQILNAAAGATSGDTGGFQYISSGNGNGTGDGGYLRVAAGDGGITGDGGFAYFGGGFGGATSGDGGGTQLIAGPAHLGNGGLLQVAGGFTDNGTGGGLQLYAGSATAGTGGDLIVKPGAGGSTNGNVIFKNLPLSDPSVSDAVWRNNDVLMFSGAANYSGVTTIAGIGAKTLTIVNGIIVSIA